MSSSPRSLPRHCSRRLSPTTSVHQRRDVHLRRQRAVQAVLLKSSTEYEHPVAGRSEHTTVLRLDTSGSLPKTWSHQRALAVLVIKIGGMGPAAIIVGAAGAGVRERHALPCRAMGANRHGPPNAPGRG